MQEGYSENPTLTAAFGAAIILWGLSGGASPLATASETTAT